MHLTIHPCFIPLASIHLNCLYHLSSKSVFHPSINWLPHFKMPFHFTAVPVVGRMVDLYVPFFTILQFIFYMGWVKVRSM